MAYLSSKHPSCHNWFLQSKFLIESNYFAIKRDYKLKVSIGGVHLTIFKASNKTLRVFHKNIGRPCMVGEKTKKKWIKAVKTKDNHNFVSMQSFISRRI